jgi:putative NADH-flavin reductase
MATTSETPMRLFILGATGGTGRALVNQALQRGYRVTAFVRSPNKIASPRERLTVVAGNPMNGDALAAALVGHDAVLSALGPHGPGPTTLVGDCARCAVSAMHLAGVRRLLVVGVAVLFEDSGIFASILRRTLLRNIAKDSADMERIVMASNLDWTIVRPPRLTNGPLTGRYSVSDDHLPRRAGGGAAWISRADVAHFMLDEVTQRAHVRRIVGIARTLPVVRRATGEARP